MRLQCGLRNDLKYGRCSVECLFIGFAEMTITPLFPQYGDDSGSDEESDITAYPPIDIEDSLPRCLMCDAEFEEGSLFHRLRVCPYCRHHYNFAARSRIRALTDSGTFEEVHRWIESIDPLVFSPRISYRVRLLKDQNRTGLMDAAVGGTAEIGGARCAIIAIDFGFLGGSMGLVVGEKVARIFELAARHKLPVVVIATSGGARIQEGVLSLTQMAKTIATARSLRDRGVPLISVLGNPSSGQILASFASVADIKIGEPDAYIGFAPLGMLQKIEDGRESFDGFRAEMLLRKGHLDMVVDREDLRNELSMVLKMLSIDERLSSGSVSHDAVFVPSRLDAWRSVQNARRSDRPSARVYIRETFREFVELHGDRVSDDDESVVIGMAYLGSQPVMVVGQERVPTDDLSVDADDSSVASFTEVYGNASFDRGGVGVSGFRKARRAAHLAADFCMPLIVLIDTPGSALGIEQELGGLPGEISEMMDLMLRLETPVISVLIGEGGGEAALAFGIADRLLMFEHSIYTPISPESGAETELRDRARAPELARSLRLTSYDALMLGVVDRVIPEPPGGAHIDPSEASRTLRRVLVSELSRLNRRHRRTLARHRRKKFRNMGEYGPEFRATVRREVKSIRASIRAGVRRVFQSPFSSESIDGGDGTDSVADVDTDAEKD